MEQDSFAQDMMDKYGIKVFPKNAVRLPYKDALAYALKEHEISGDNKYVVSIEWPNDFTVLNRDQIDANMLVVAIFESGIWAEREIKTTWHTLSEELPEKCLCSFHKSRIDTYRLEVEDDD